MIDLFFYDRGNENALHSVTMKRKRILRFSVGAVEYHVLMKFNVLVEDKWKGEIAYKLFGE